MNFSFDLQLKTLKIFKIYNIYIYKVLPETMDNILSC